MPDGIENLERNRSADEQLAELRAAVDELREELGAERAERQEALEQLGRVLDARTERFV